MILGVLLLLAAAPGRVILMDDTVEVPARQWEAFNLNLRQQPAIVECSYSVLGGGPGVRVALMHRADMERFRAGIRHHVLAATEFEKSGSLRYPPGRAGEYSVVVDNRLSGRGIARVHLTVAMRFVNGQAQARELPPGRRRAVILLTLAYVAAVAVFAVRRVRRRRPRD
jgi:hypothetical protein